VLLLPNFQRSFSLFIATLFNWECKCRGFFISTKFIILVCVFCEQKRIENLARFLQNILRTIHFFLADCKDTSTLIASQFFFPSFITNDCERTMKKIIENDVEAD
jgi:hypothetical protein